MTKPRMSHDALYVLLREGAVEAFNRRRAAGEQCGRHGTRVRHARRGSG